MRPLAWVPPEQCRREGHTLGAQGLHNILRPRHGHLLDGCFGEVWQADEGLARRSSQLSEEHLHVIDLCLCAAQRPSVKSRPSGLEDHQTECPHIDGCPEGHVSEQDLRCPVADRGHLDAVGQAGFTVRIPSQRRCLNTHDVLCGTLPSPRNATHVNYTIDSLGQP